MDIEFLFTCVLKIFFIIDVSLLQFRAEFAEIMKKKTGRSVSSTPVFSETQGECRSLQGEISINYTLKMCVCVHVCEEKKLGTVIATNVLSAKMLI